LKLNKLPGVGRLLQALGINAVPATGFFAANWSIGTALLLYWGETLLVILCVSFLIARHRRLTRRAGHWGIQVTTTRRVGGQTTTSKSKTTHLVSFLAVMIPFTLAHGVFVGLLAFLVLPEKTGGVPSFSDLRAGGLGIASLAAFGLALDSFGLRQRPFAWIERVSQRAMGRMFITHLTIIFGMAAMGMTGAPRALFAVFVGLKTLFDLGGAFARQEVSAPPPGWAKHLDRLSTKGESFSTYWRRARIEEQEQKAAAERELAPGERPS
jgi:hypothetical protein